MARTLRVGIVGAGIGGLTAAIALRARGHEVVVLEKASQLTEIGAGIIVGPNAVKVLRALGLEKRMLEAAVEPDNHLLRNWKDGRILDTTPMRGSFMRKFGAGYLQLHRADLLEILKDALPEAVIRFDSACAGVASAEGAAVNLTSGGEMEFDVLVGADGIKSAVRAGLFGEEAPRFTGNVCWRGITMMEHLPRNAFGSDIHVWLGPAGHVVNYQVRSGQLMNFVAIYREDNWRQESWSVEADPQELGHTYTGWNEDVLALIKNASRCYKWGLFDRDPLPLWSVDRVTLLGDAAHPMLPYLAQGAAMAMEDGYILAALLAAEPNDIKTTLKKYEECRRPRTARVQLGARERMHENQLTSPFARLKRNLRYTWRRLLNPAATSYNIDWIYDYNVKSEFG